MSKVTIKDVLNQVLNEASININPLEGGGLGKAVVFLNDDINRYSFKATLPKHFVVDENMRVNGRKMTVIVLPEETAEAYLLNFIHEAEKEQVTAANRATKQIVKFLGKEFDDYDYTQILGSADVIDGKKIVSSKGLKGKYYLFNNKLEFNVLKEQSRKDTLTIQYVSILGARK